MTAPADAPVTGVPAPRQPWAALALTVLMPTIGSAAAFGWWPGPVGTGIYWVATLEPHRRRGLGEALRFEAASAAPLFTSDDMAQGYRAMAEKKTPDFEGK